MKKHKIDWLNIPGFKGETWNPIIGCSKVSPGCENCYAEKMAKRLAYIDKTAHYNAVLNGYAGHTKITGWNGKTVLVDDQLEKPLKWKNPRAIFVCSMGDLFHDTVPFEWIDKVIGVIRDNPQHVFLILTKRPQNMKTYFEEYYGKGKIFDASLVLPNLWLGVTAENQLTADARIPILLSIPAAKRFVSIEPMLEAICLKKWLMVEKDKDGLSRGFGNLDWIIVGGESGHKARPMHPEWVRSIRNQCKTANVPFFFKQWGEWKEGSVPNYNPIIVLNNGKFGNYEQTKQYRPIWNQSRPVIMSKVGKKEAGCELDGQYHKEFPKI
jgi:protein gp37